ncbi:MAG: hypothetical protein CSB34_05845 [Desulfobulbus propionicus]|nr:MAG: hypothetical protein CSB34_05845 [Desulfobulbus propionicus]
MLLEQCGYQKEKETTYGVIWQRELVELTIREKLAILEKWWSMRKKGEVVRLKYHSIREMMPPAIFGTTQTTLTLCFYVGFPGASHDRIMGLWRIRHGIPPYAKVS